LLYLLHREGKLGASELLTKAFHIADSYVCGVEPRPFLRLRREFETNGPNEASLATLFAPYTAFAEQCLQQWGLRHGEADPSASDPET
jgi:hypothetical protein